MLDKFDVLSSCIKLDFIILESKFLACNLSESYVTTDVSMFKSSVGAYVPIAVACVNM